MQSVQDIIEYLTNGNVITSKMDFSWNELVVRMADTFRDENVDSQQTHLFLDTWLNSPQEKAVQNFLTEFQKNDTWEHPIYDSNFQVIGTLSLRTADVSVSDISKVSTMHMANVPTLASEDLVLFRLQNVTLTVNTFAHTIDTVYTLAQIGPDIEITKAMLGLKLKTVASSCNLNFLINSAVITDLLRAKSYDQLREIIVNINGLSFESVKAPWDYQHMMFDFESIFVKHFISHIALSDFVPSHITEFLRSIQNILPNLDIYEGLGMVLQTEKQKLILAETKDGYKRTNASSSLWKRHSLSQQLMK